VIRKWEPFDVSVCAYCAGVIFLLFLRADAVADWWAHALAHAAVIGAVLLTARLGWGEARAAVRFWRMWDIAAFMAVLFVSTTQVVHQVNPNDVDRFLIRADRAIGGDALLRWVQAVSTPWLDEAAKICWVSYYVLPLLPGVALYLGRKDAAFREAKAILGPAWLVSFAFYFALPARGPLYFKEELGLRDPSEGVWAAGTLKSVVGQLEGAEARDTFPSGHVLIAGLVIGISARNRLRRTLWVCLPLGIGVIASTVVLRYHYVVDVIAGLALCVPVVWMGTAWQRLVEAARAGIAPRRPSE